MSNTTVDPIPNHMTAQRPGAAVSLDRVTKRFDTADAVSALSLEIAEREFLVLLGPSGCGKSTALRLLAGLEYPDEGTIRIDGVDVTDLEAKARDIAMVFQNYALYPHMTVRRNIEFPLRNRRVPAKERKELVDRTVDALALTDLLDRKPAQLSGGQRQRVALARALVRRPAAFLMDEPLSNLDAKLRVQMRAELIALQRRLETTVVYVTHDQVEAMTMGERIAIMDHGVLQQVGTPTEVYGRPANAFVAGFVGSPPMNLLTAHVDRDGPGATVSLDGARVTLPVGLAELPAGDVLIGIRPEDAAIEPDAALRAEVTVVEELGHERQVVCRTPSAGSVVVRLATDGPVPRLGETVGIVAAPSALHLFDAASGDRIGP
ncbi:MAG: ABC transporter ATP-binding protein [Microthrixaceae bacterium]